MSENCFHCVFYQFDGEDFAKRMKEFFSGRRYNVQLSLQELQNAKIRNVSSPGVFVLLLTPESFNVILSQKHLDLNAIFPSPDYSFALFINVERIMTDVKSLLSSRIKDFSRWKVMEYSTMSSLGIHIMELIEQFDENCRRLSLQQKVKVWPPEGVKSNELALLIFTDPVTNDSTVRLVQKLDGKNRIAERLNHMTFCFNVGDMEPGANEVEVFVDDTSFGTVELNLPSVELRMAKISSLLQNVINPIEFLCQCLHNKHSTREELDCELEEMLSNNNSKFSNVFETVYSETFKDFHSECELPTLLHFCAMYGFERFCMKLLRLSGCKEAIKVKNKDGLLPYQIALNKGFDHLASILQNSDNVPSDRSTFGTEIFTEYKLKDSPQNRPRLSNSNEQCPELTAVGGSTRNSGNGMDSKISDQITSQPHRRMTNMTSEQGTGRFKSFPGKPTVPVIYGKPKKTEAHYHTIDE